MLLIAWFVFEKPDVEDFLGIAGEIGPFQLFDRPFHGVLRVVADRLSRFVANYHKRPCYDDREVVGGELLSQLGNVRIEVRLGESRFVAEAFPLSASLATLPAIRTKENIRIVAPMSRSRIINPP